jgi:hypothetical protein
MKIGRSGNKIANVIVRKYAPQPIAAKEQKSRLRKGSRKDIRFKYFSLTESAIEDISLRMVGCFI